MLKVRLQGTVRDIKWFQQYLEKHGGIAVQRVSRPFANKGTNRYFRVYMEVEKAEK